MISPILAVLALFVLQTLLPASCRYLFSGPGVAARLTVALGSRDAQPAQTRMGERAQRALTDLFESLPVFLTLALLLVMRAPASELGLQGAWLFAIMRAVYVPAYLSGVFGVRSLVWAGGLAGLVMMLVALL